MYLMYNTQYNIYVRCVQHPQKKPKKTNSSAQIVDKLICKERKGLGNEEFPEFNPQDGL